MIVNLCQTSFGISTNSDSKKMSPRYRSFDLTNVFLSLRWVKRGWARVKKICSSASSPTSLCNEPTLVCTIISRSREYLSEVLVAIMFHAGVCGTRVSKAFHANLIRIRSRRLMVGGQTWWVLIIAVCSAPTALVESLMMASWCVWREFGDLELVCLSWQHIGFVRPCGKGDSRETTWLYHLSLSHHYSNQWMTQQNARRICSMIT